MHYEEPTAEGNPTGRRHLAVALDVAALLADDAFRAHAVSRLQTIDRPDVVIVPRLATEALRALAVEALDLNPSQVIDVSFGEMEPQVIERLTGVECALVPTTC